ncbi:MAG TPA: hypothetical protein VGR96_18050, partial [Acidobacteriaceae bacterium]|nr:hypothetical protein [Acidobacteriaceae bacterium]
LILAFIFVSPILINYHDRPQETLTSSNGVVVKTSGTGVLVYEIGAEEIGVGTGAAALKTKLLDRIQAISGRVEMDRYSERRDASGRVTDYRVWAHRPE